MRKGKLPAEFLTDDVTCIDITLQVFKVYLLMVQLQINCKHTIHTR